MYATNKLAKRTVLGTVLMFACFAALHAHAALRFDCGTPGSPVADGYQRLTDSDSYSKEKGFGWEGVDLTSADFGKSIDFPSLGSFSPYVKENLNSLNTDGVTSTEDLVFRVDVPDGSYRVDLTIGDMSQHIGSMDVYVNDDLVAEHVAAWSPGGGFAGHHRRLMTLPNGWWTHVRATVSVKQGLIRIRLTNNQSYYDKMMVEQVETEKPLEADYWRVGVNEPPYYYIGWPFVHNSIMAIDVVPHREPPVVGENNKLRLERPAGSPGLAEAIRLFNNGNYVDALAAVRKVREPEAQVAKAIVTLWLIGRLETGLENDQALIRSAIPVLHNYVDSHPEEDGVRELLDDALLFDKALDIHITRGEAPLGENHFMENCKAIGYWWFINEGTPLYYKTQLYIARAEHMLIPYFPARGTYKEIFKKLEKEFPDDRFVRYHLHEEWEPHGDGTHYYDWRIKDYESKVTNSPEWVRAIYPAFQNIADWSEWWINFKQQPTGSIGGGWGDDVEIVGAFGYMGYVSPDVSDVLIQGTATLMDGLWNFSEIDPELGFCLPLTDAEHAAEWTGNTLGMMVKIDFGNPVWIERSMKTAKLMRDLWTDFNLKDRRHFRANYFSAAQIGSGDQMNDSWINYRAIRPAAAVLSYNRNPAVARLFIELADAWVADSLSIERGKPKGIIPAEIGFPEGLIGGTHSPNWYTAYKPPGTGNSDWHRQPYKPYIQDLLLTAYQTTRDPKYLQPLRLEYEFVADHGELPEATTGLRLQGVPDPETFGQRNKGAAEKRKQSKVLEGEAGEPGTPEWVAEKLIYVDQWLRAKRIMEGREGELENDLTKNDIVRAGIWVNSELAWRWPMHTTEAGPTDRIGFVGMINPYIVYTGGWIGGPLLEAAVTYFNTTRDFAAAVLASDEQGFRLLYHSLAPEPREIGIRPWHLEPNAKYRLRYGPDADEDEMMDRVVETRDFIFPQPGSPVTVAVEPRLTYVIEVDQLERGTPPGLAPDPGLSSGDIRFVPGYNLVLARIHNVGSEPVRNVRLDFYNGDPEDGGTPIGSSVIPNIEAPNGLEPRSTTVGINWNPGDGAQDIYVVVDPNGEITNEITTFNNVAHKILPEDRPLTPEEESKAALSKAFGPAGP